MDRGNDGAGTDVGSGATIKCRDESRHGGESRRATDSANLRNTNWP